jgi:hypothetical protein
MAGTRTFLRQRAARVKSTLGLGPLFQSRVLSSLSRKPSSSACQTILGRPKHACLSSFDAGQLQSAFPTKTVIFLLVLGGLVYYFVEVQEADWTDDVLLSFQDDQSHATPLHFNGNKEELDHYLQVSLLVVHMYKVRPCFELHH